MEKAFDLFNSGDYEGALKLFEQALADNPKENHR
jgi:tetratricopeptide (TPR) repeat protein